MSNRITKITLENYRAFYGTTEINIPDGKNVLIYGENGSGKSSLYEGLKRCFESFTNPNVYFSTHLQATTPAQIQLLFDGQPDPYIFDANTANTSPDYKQDINAAYAKSGFFSYRELLRTHLMTNLYDEEVFQTAFAQLLIRRILADYTLSTGETVFAFWAKLYRSAKATTKTTELNNFHIEFSKILNDINISANTFLQFFDENLDVQLEAISGGIIWGVPQNGQSAQLHPIYKVELLVTLNGVPMEKRDGSGQAEELHLTLLNEARLSALAIAIYLAELKLRPDSNNYKILFLDDIFIGLDMSNRLPLLEILRTEFADWQIFITTYDKHWFEIAKRELNDWLPIEMYVGEEKITSATGAKITIQLPTIIPLSLNYYEKAKAYFKTKDYPACANYLRKELESLIKERLPIELKSDFGAKPHSLSHLWQILSELYTSLKINVDASIFKMLNTTLLVLLNPQSHDGLTFPIYEAELKTAFKVRDDIKNLPIIQKIIILQKGSIGVFTHPTENYTFTFTLNSDWQLDICNTMETMHYPKCNVHHFQYNNINFFDFKNNTVLPQATISKIQKDTPKLDKMFNFLKAIPILGITDKMLYKNIIIDNNWVLNDILESAKNLHTKRI